jgi:Fe-S-cluster containining protein
MKPDVVLLVQDEAPDLDAGEFTRWLTGMDAAIRGRAESGVPCGDCNACCRSRYFIEIKPSDAAARRRIPAALIFDAPGAPAGYQVLGYDGEGRCPMLKGGVCSIYEDRPATCRTYDCRMFAATGIAEPGADKADVTARAARWRFHYHSAEGIDQHRLLQAGTRALLRMVADDAITGPASASQLAMLAIRLFPVFTELGERLGPADDGVSEIVRDRIQAALPALRSEGP